MHCEERILRTFVRRCQIAGGSGIPCIETPASTVMFVVFLTDKNTLVDQHAHNLFDKERIPFGSRQDCLTQYLGEIVGVEQGINEFAALLTRKSLQIDNRKITTSTTPIFSALKEIGTGRAEKQYWNCTDALVQIF